jgi:eukaryotic-like serine/threonine-protein kinase
VTPSAAAPSPSQADAADVVQRYFAAINAGDYATAWALGGQNLVGSYQDFVDGFADTVQDTLSVISVQGDTVQIELDAEQSDGSHRFYAGTYTVSDGVIVAADITQR